MECDCTFSETKPNEWYNIETVVGRCLKKSVSFLNDMHTADQLLRGMDINEHGFEEMDWKDQIRIRMYPRIAQNVYGGSIEGKLAGRELTALLYPMAERITYEPRAFGINSAYPLGLPTSGSLKFQLYPHPEDLGEAVPPPEGRYHTPWIEHEVDFALVLRAPSGLYYISRDVAQDQVPFTLVK